MSTDATVGRITFGPHRENSAARGPDWPERREGHTALRPDGEGGLEIFDPHPAPEFCLLLELFAGDGGNSHRLYWAGRSNRIEAGPRGIEATYDPHKARRIPLAMRDVAEALAEALNRIPVPNSDGVVNVWRAVEHGFH